MKSRTLGEAAIKAGYSPKHARKCGHQALQALRNKNVPEIMSELGLSVPVLIDEHLRPLLKATETKFAQDDGKFSGYIDVENLDVRDRALDKAFRLHGAYAPKDPKEAAQFGIKVVIIDVPRPQHGVFMPDVGPGQLPGASGSNGHKPGKDTWRKTRLALYLARRCRRVSQLALAGSTGRPKFCERETNAILYKIAGDSNVAA